MLMLMGLYGFTLFHRRFNQCLSGVSKACPPLSCLSDQQSIWISLITVIRFLGFTIYLVFPLVTCFSFVIDLDNNGSLVYSSFFFCTSVGAHIFSYNFIEATSIGCPLGKRR
jgi:hypothetical protein